MVRFALMTSPNAKRLRAAETAARARRDRLKAIPLKVILFIVGGILTAVIVYEAFSYLPGGPERTIYVQRVVDPRNVACLNWEINFAPRKEVTNLDIEIQMLHTITDADANLAHEAHFPNSRTVTMQGWGFGTDAKNQCVIPARTSTDKMGITANYDGNLLRIHAPRIGPSNELVAAAVGSAFNTTIKPNPNYFEAYYDDTVFGIPIRKGNLHLQFININPQDNSPKSTTPTSR